MAGGGSPLVPIRMSRLKFCARIFSSYSFPYKRKKIRDLDNTEKNLDIDEDNDEWDFDGDDDGLETDDHLSCFRGLVLDISYRSTIFFVLLHFSLLFLVTMYSLILEQDILKEIYGNSSFVLRIYVVI